MLPLTFLPLIALFTAPALATTCPKPTVDVPAGPIDPLVISGTATAPCGLIYIYIDGQFMFVDGASGASYENGAPLTFSCKNDLHIAYGEKRVKVEAVDGSGEFASSWSDEVVITYGP